MKLNSLLVIVMMMVGTLNLYSQSRYKVLTITGDIQYTSDKTVKKVIVGDWIEGDFVLTLHENAYIGIFSDQGRTLELRDQGTYSAAQVQKLIKDKKESSLTAKYANYLINGQDITFTEKIKATGAVERNGSSRNNRLEINLPVKSMVYGNSILLSWTGEYAERYEVEVTDLHNERLAVYKARGNELQLDLTSSELAKHETLLVHVRIAKKSKFSEKIALQRLSPDEKKRHEEALSTLVAGNSSAIDTFIQGTYFLENDLFADAFTSFARANKLAPDVETYNHMYNQWFAANAM